MMPSQITRSSHSSLPEVAPASGDATGVSEQTPQQARTVAFFSSGELAVAFGRTSAAPEQDSVRLLSALQRELDKQHPSWHTVAQLCQSLAEVGTTEQGWHQLASEDQLPALRELLDRCTHRLADMPAAHASHDSLSQACEGLRTARLHQSVARLTARPSSLARAMADLLTLTHLDPETLGAEPPVISSYTLFSHFVRTAKQRTADLNDSLQRQPDAVVSLLRSHADTLNDLEMLPGALQALTENCQDAPARNELRELAEVAGALLQLLLEHDLLPRLEEISIEPGEAPAPGHEPAEPRLTTRQALLKVGGNLVRKFDAYGALAPMDDKALLALMRTPAPHLSPDQMHAFLNKHVLHLTQEQRDIVSNTPLPFAPEEDIEARYGMGFDEKLRLGRRLCA